MYLCTVEFNWFWQIVNTECPATISKTNCMGCHSYSVTFCQADYETCYSTYNSLTTALGEDFACPYVICRRQLLQYMHDTANR